MPRTDNASVAARQAAEADAMLEPVRESRPLARLPAEVRSKLTADVLAAYEREFAQLMDVWKALETKAQASTAIAGVLVAGTVALAKELPATMSDIVRGGTAVLATTLLMSVVFSLMALGVEPVYSAPSGDEIAENVRDLLAAEISEDTAEERLERFVGDRVRSWQRANMSRRSANERKANWAKAAQACLVIGIGLGAFLALTILILGTATF
ncbi:MAG: hypothetical protein ABIT20_04750 [Gemmatimonadaceae bacterium]